MTTIEVSQARKNLANIVRELQGYDGPFASAADARFDNNPGVVRQWLQSALDRARRGEYLLWKPTDPPVEGLYVEMNRFDSNPDEWYMDAFACAAPPEAGERTIISPEFDATAGRLLENVTISGLRLTGMEQMQRAFDRHRNETGLGRSELLAQELVALRFFDLLASAWERGRVDGRVVAAVHDWDLYLLLQPV